MEAIVQDGKIQSFTYTLSDATIEQLKALDNAEVTADEDTMLGPGAKVGEMVLSKGPDQLDLSIPPIFPFCNANPQFVGGSKVGVPRVYTVECSMPPLPQVAIGVGLETDTQENLEKMWPAFTSELYLNGKQVDQEAFGRLDAVIPSSGLPGEDPNKVFETPLRTWNVMLNNLQPGPLELRNVWNIAEELKDSQATMPAGIYDITYKITVDPALAVAEEAPASVDLVLEQVTVFDGFNAAVNAHDGTRLSASSPTMPLPASPTTCRSRPASPARTNCAPGSRQMPPTTSMSRPPARKPAATR